MMPALQLALKLPGAQDELRPEPALRQVIFYHRWCGGK